MEISLTKLAPQSYRLRLGDTEIDVAKAAENNHALLEKLYTNMSERSRKIFAEDLAYKYKDGVPSSEVGAAIGRLMRVVRDLQDEENPA